MHKIPAQTTKREAQAMNFKDFILSCGHFSIEAIQTSLLSCFLSSEYATSL